MTRDELLLNINDYNFDSLLCQTEIKTEADINNYQAEGYYAVYWTAETFLEKFGVDPEKVFYTKSLGVSSLYFNRNTLAAMPLNLEFLQLEKDGTQKYISGLHRAIKDREQAVASDNYTMSIDTLAPSMRMDYFRMLIEKRGTDFPGLYSLFISTYKYSDYGFKNFDSQLFSDILKAKTPGDDEKTSKQIENLPEVINVYRGGNSASTPYNKSFSWSLDINVANFFAARRGSGDGYIAVGTVKKSDIIEAFLDDDSEQEVLVDPNNVNITSVIEVKGLNQLTRLLPIVTPMYQKYRDEMYQLNFAQHSSIHGRAHEARVLLLCLLIAELLELPASDRRLLATAAIYHDTQRTNDGVDPTHGKSSKEYYISNVSRPSPLVAFLCEYHCLPDEDAYQEITRNRALSKNRKRVKLLYDIFKDADALDRVRFEIRDLNLNILRLPVSKTLTLVARITLEQLKVDSD